MVTLLLHTQLDGKRMEVGKAIEKVAQVYDKEQKIGQNQQKSL
jgi:hypothetical protein